MNKKDQVLYDQAQSILQGMATEIARQKAWNEGFMEMLKFAQMVNCWKS